MKTSVLRAFLDNRSTELSAAVETPARLELLCAESPELALRVLGDGTTHVTQQAHLLARLVRSSVAGRRIVVRLQRLSHDALLQVLEGLRLRRLNGRRAQRIGLAALIGHRDFAELAAHHRKRVVRIIKHLLGERTWSTVQRRLRVGSVDGDRVVATCLLKYASDAAQAKETLQFLAGIGLGRAERRQRRWAAVPWLGSRAKDRAFSNELLRRSSDARRDLECGRGMPRSTLAGLRGTFHRDTPRKILRTLSAPVAVRVRNDGAVTATLKQRLASTEQGAFAELVGAKPVRPLPEVSVRAAVVLDLSASMASSGERLHHPAALGLALVGLLSRYVKDVSVFQVGGSVALNGSGVPRPAGVTDLAAALLTAARGSPDTVLIVTDGYENFRQGDVDQVIRGLQRLRLPVTVEQITPVIAASEDLSRRRLSNLIPLVPVEHETAVGELAVRLLLGARETLSPQALADVERLLFRD